VRDERMIDDLYLHAPNLVVTRRTRSSPSG
jgi:hypothetical protein